MKKILIMLFLLILTGCDMYYINNKSFEEIIDVTISADNKLYNINNKGYKYYLPIGFNVYKDQNNNQVLVSNSIKFYLNIDLVSYFHKFNIKTNHDINDYMFHTFSNKDKTGYLKITEDNNYFFIEICYNYAIIEVEVEEDDLQYAVSRAIIILNSIQYNDKIIEKTLSKQDIQSSETIYEIPSPENKSESNILQHIEENEK